MKSEKALSYFNNGYNCSQAVLAAFCEDFGLDVSKASDLAVAFGGGVGRQGRMCGCISGALMVIGLKYGKDSTNELDTRIKNYDLSKNLCKKFMHVNGGLDCKDIIKYNLNNLEERKKAQEENVFSTRCSQVVSNTVKLLEEFMNEQQAN